MKDTKMDIKTTGIISVVLALLMVMGVNATAGKDYVSNPSLGIPGFFMVGTTNSTGVYAPGGLFGWAIKFINGVPQKYDYWQNLAKENCLENTAGMSPQNIRAMIDDPTMNCEKNVTKVLSYSDTNLYAKATANVTWKPKHKNF